MSTLLLLAALTQCPSGQCPAPTSGGFLFRRGLASPPSVTVVVPSPLYQPSVVAAPVAVPSAPLASPQAPPSVLGGYRAEYRVSVRARGRGFHPVRWLIGRILGR